jgi:predicted metalloprotease with PDZ domain
VVAESFLPYQKYVFLLLFRPGGGGLEHRYSNLSTAAVGGAFVARGVGEQQLGRQSQHPHVSYCHKGNALGLLLDARIRRTTNGRASFDDVMRLAYQRYSGARGFTADQFRQTTEEVAGVDGSRAQSHRLTGSTTPTCSNTGSGS